MPSLFVPIFHIRQISSCLSCRYSRLHSLIWYFWIIRCKLNNTMYHKNAPIFIVLWFYIVKHFINRKIIIQLFFNSTKLNIGMFLFWSFNLFTFDVNIFQKLLLSDLTMYDNLSYVHYPVYIEVATDAATDAATDRIFALRLPLFLSNSLFIFQFKLK